MFFRDATSGVVMEKRRMKTCRDAERSDMKAGHGRLMLTHRKEKTRICKERPEWWMMNEDDSDGEGEGKQVI